MNAAKPTALRAMQGNPGKRALNAREPRPEQGAMPQAPRWLKAAARREWRRVARMLYNAGLLTQVDKAVLAMYCQAYGRMVEAEKELEQGMSGGEVILSDRGNLYINPWLNVATAAAKDVLRLAQELGMTPAARSRVQVERPRQKTLAEMLAEDLFVGAGHD